VEPTISVQGKLKTEQKRAKQKPETETEAKAKRNAMPGKRNSEQIIK